MGPIIISLSRTNRHLAYAYSWYIKRRPPNRETLEMKVHKTRFLLQISNIMLYFPALYSYSSFFAAVIVMQMSPLWDYKRFFSYS